MMKKVLSRSTRAFFGPGGFFLRIRMREMVEVRRSHAKAYQTMKVLASVRS